MVKGIIMASGFSRRMGRNKLTLPFKGKPIIERVIDAARISELEELILVAREEEIIEIGHKNNLKTVVNNHSELGQSESVKLGISNLGGEADGYMFLTGDQPLISRDIINRLILRFQENKNKIIVPTCSGKRSSPVIFPYEFKDELLSLEGDTGGREIIKAHMKDTLFVRVDETELLMDIDTLEDYARMMNNNN